MARDEVDMTPVETRDDLVAWLAAGSKPKSRFRIGTEHEKFPFAVRHEPVPYDGPRGIRALLEGMQMLLGWEPITDEGNIIGLLDVTGGGAISLEPGGNSNCRARRSRPCTRPRPNCRRICRSCAKWRSRSASAFSASE